MGLFARLFLFGLLGVWPKNIWSHEPNAAFCFSDLRRALGPIRLIGDSLDYNRFFDRTAQSKLAQLGFEIRNNFQFKPLPYEETRILQSVFDIYFENFSRRFSPEIQKGLQESFEKFKEKTQNAKGDLAGSIGSYLEFFKSITGEVIQIKIREFEKPLGGKAWIYNPNLNLPAGIFPIPYKSLMTRKYLAKFYEWEWIFLAMLPRSLIDNELNQIHALRKSIESSDMSSVNKENLTESLNSIYVAIGIALNLEKSDFIQWRMQNTPLNDLFFSEMASD